MPLRPFPYPALLGWYRKHGRHALPWRTHPPGTDPAYRVWLSEILLQQTQSARVVAFFERMTERYPTVEYLARTTFEDFFPYYDGLGYYSRARNLLSAARIVADEFKGTFPRETEKLRSLPGVGPYTAEAVRAFAFGLPTLPFDTNLEKAFSRYHFWDRFRKLTPSEKAEILTDFKTSGVSGGDAGAALMDFSNLVSFNAKSKVDWHSYPLPECRFFETRGRLEAEKKVRRTVFPMKDSKLIAVLTDAHGKILFSSRSDSYAPFVLSPPLETDPREAVKAHFLALGLSVSVRPPYSKGFSGGDPLAFFRVRVQTWAVKFASFGTDEFALWWKIRSQGADADFELPPA